MALRYKVDVIAALKAAGFTSYRIRQEKLINQTALQKLREGRMIAWEQLENICRLLKCQPGDLIEYVEDGEEAADV
jgi:putative transcriptional regulator